MADLPALQIGQGVPSALGVAGQAVGLNNAMLEGQRTQQSIQNMILSNQQQQQNLNQQRTNRLGQLLAPLLSASDSELEGGQLVHNTLKTAVQNGDITSAQAQTWESSHPLGQSAASYRPGITRALIGTLAGPDAITRLVGGQQTTTLPGGQTATVNVPGTNAAPGSNPSYVGGGYGGGLTPEGGAGMVNVPNADGTTTPMTTRDWNSWNNTGSPRDQSGKPLVAPGIPNITSGTAPNGMSLTTPGTNVGGTRGAGLASQIQPSKPLISSPTSNQLTVAQTQTEKQQNDVTNLSSPGFQAANQALNSVVNLSPTSLSGKGTDWLGNAKSVISNIAPSVAKALDINVTGVNDRAELAKAMARIATVNGNRSDADLFHQYESNPNMVMPPGAVQNVARTIIGLNNQERALTLEAAGRAQNLPQNTQTHYGPVKTDLSQQVDLNGFTPLSKDQMTTYINSLPPSSTPEGQAARVKLHNSIRLQNKYNTPNTGTIPAGELTGHP